MSPLPPKCTVKPAASLVLPEYAKYVKHAKAPGSFFPGAFFLAGLSLASLHARVPVGLGRWVSDPREQ